MVIKKEERDRFIERCIKETESKEEERDRFYKDLNKITYILKKYVFSDKYDGMYMTRLKKGEKEYTITIKIDGYFSFS